MANNPKIITVMNKVSEEQLGILADNGTITKGDDTLTADEGAAYLTPDTSVSYAAQTLTTEQKTQARTNIGAGTSNFSGSYTDLTDKPTIPTGNDKVDKTSSASKVYGTDSSGNQTTYGIDSLPTQNSTNLVTSGGVYSSKLGKPQNNFAYNKTQLHLNYNQGDAIWTASEIDRACIVYIRGNFGAANTFRIATSNGEYIYRDLVPGQNSIMFLCQAGDKIEWYIKDNVYWCDTVKVNFGGIVI